MLSGLKVLAIGSAVGVFGSLGYLKSDASDEARAAAPSKAEVCRAGGSNLPAATAQECYREMVRAYGHLGGSIGQVFAASRR
ncbi:hypothetical protein LJR290_003157 [Variovorax sp. LjRoot290]|uniref:hypothetical protein n=1 Tax=unclassified Variovorax TaxID=663243 RepID=UPI003ECFA731